VRWLLPGSYVLSYVLLGGVTSGRRGTDYYCINHDMEKMESE